MVITQLGRDIAGVSTADALQGCGGYREDECNEKSEIGAGIGLAKT